MPDATTAVPGGAFEGDVAPRPNGNNGQVSVADLTQIRRFVAGLDTDFQYNEFQRADCAPLDTHGDGVLFVADVIQARRFAAGLDPGTDADGPFAPGPFAQKPAATKAPTPAREVRPALVNRFGNKAVVGVELVA